MKVESGVIKWLRIEPRRTGEFTVWLSEVFDTGNEQFFDLNEFEPLDPDEPEGASRTFTDWESALAHSDSLGASRERFLPHGRIQDVYKDFLLRGRN